MRFYFSKNHPHKRVAPTPADSPSCLAQKSLRSLCFLSTVYRHRARGAREEKQERQERQEGHEGQEFLFLLSLLSLLSFLSFLSLLPPYFAPPPLFTGIFFNTRAVGGWPLSLQVCRVAAGNLQSHNIRKSARGGFDGVGAILHFHIFPHNHSSGALL